MPQPKIILPQFAATPGRGHFPAHDPSIDPPPPEPIYPKPYGGYIGGPIHLTSTATFSANQGGKLNAAALMNPNPGPMEIHEIKFSLRSKGLVNGNTMLVSLSLGKLPITKSYIPVSNFGRVLNHASERLIDSSGMGTTYYYVEYVWRLPKPLYVPTGSTIIPSAQHKGIISQDIDLWVSYSGRSLSPGTRPPSKIFVPWVCAYTSKNFAGGGGNDTDNSSETDLANPFDVPVVAQRFIGRWFVFSSVSSASVNDEVGVNASGIMTDAIQVKMIDSSGFPLVKDYSQFRSVFDATTRGWETQHVVPPKTFYKIFLSYADPTISVNVSYFQMQAVVSLVGYREVSAQ